MDIAPPSSPSLRSLEEVRATAHTAGLPITADSSVQLLHFGDCLSESHLKLMELPNDLLEEMKIGQQLVIRGEMNDEAVLCTNNKTYELKEAQTSNSLLLCPSLKYNNNNNQDSISNKENLLIPTEVNGCVFNYYELRHCRPKLEKLKFLLLENPYRGELEERENDKKYYTYSDLLDIVQASEDELLKGLHQVQACVINNYWRVLELDYRDRVFQSILSLLEEEDWSWRHVPLTACCEKLSQLEPSFIIEHCLNCYGERKEREGEEMFYELIEDKVCQFCAELFLRQSGKFNYHEFMESWPTSVPLGMTATIDQLKGLALTDMSSIPAVIWYFPVSDLPEDPASRFSKLFNVKEKWTYDELHPYIRDLESPGQSLKALLLKYSRVSGNAQGKRIYNAKLTAF